MVSNVSKYRDMLQDTWLISPVPYTYEHKYDDFWGRIEEEKHKTLLNCAREFGEDAPWKELSKELTKDDIEFVREFKQFIYWDEIDRGVKYDNSFYKEFKEEIETALQEKLDIDTSLVNALISNI